MKINVFHNWWKMIKRFWNNNFPSNGFYYALKFSSKRFESPALNFLIIAKQWIFKLAAKSNSSHNLYSSFLRLGRYGCPKYYPLLHANYGGLGAHFTCLARDRRRSLKVKESKLVGHPPNLWPPLRVAACAHFHTLCGHDKPTSC